MPPALPVLAAIGGGSAVAGGVAIAGTALAVGGAIADRNSIEDANESVAQQQQASQDFIEKATAQAREDLFALFPQAQELRAEGAQASLDIFSQSVPAQLQAFQGGNIAAQNQLRAGQSQFQNAILGSPSSASFLASSAGSGLGGLKLPTVPTRGGVPGAGLAGLIK